MKEFLNNAIWGQKKKKHTVWCHVLMRLTSHMIQKVSGDNFGGDFSKLLWLIAISLKGCHPQSPPRTCMHAILQNTTHWRIKIWHVYFKTNYATFQIHLTTFFAPSETHHGSKLDSAENSQPSKIAEKGRKQESEYKAIFHSWLLTSLLIYSPFPPSVKWGQ